MNKQVSLRTKLILLLILSVAAGFIFLLPKEQTKTKNLNTSISKTKDNTKSNEKWLNCNNQIAKNDDLSQILNNNSSGNTCLFVGCSGFSF